MAIDFCMNYEGTEPFSDLTFQVALQTGVAEVTAAFPGPTTTKYRVHIKYSASQNIYVGRNVAPNIPTLGTVTAQPYVDFRPEIVFVYGGDVLHFITPDTTAYFGGSAQTLTK